MLRAGSTCRKKLRLTNNNDPSIINININDKGEYRKIESCITFSDDTRNEIIKLFTNRLDYYKKHNTHLFNSNISIININLKLLFKLNYRYNRYFNTIYDDFLEFKKSIIKNTWITILEKIKRNIKNDNKNETKKNKVTQNKHDDQYNRYLKYIKQNWGVDEINNKNITFTREEHLFFEK